MIALQCLVR